MLSLLSQHSNHILPAQFIMDIVTKAVTEASSSYIESIFVDYYNQITTKGSKYLKDLNVNSDIGPIIANIGKNELDFNLDFAAQSTQKSQLPPNIPLIADDDFESKVKRSRKLDDTDILQEEEPSKRINTNTGIEQYFVNTHKNNNGEKKKKGKKM